MNSLLRSAKRHSMRNAIVAVNSWKEPRFLLVAAHCLIVLVATSLGQTCRDGCYFSNTYHGVDAFPNEAIGSANTALGYLSLSTDPVFNSFRQNTGVGALTLAPGTDSTIGGSYTAVGAMALQYVGLQGSAGYESTAIGVNAIIGSAASDSNTAIGVDTLKENGVFTGADSNDVAIGSSAMANNLLSSYATAIGSSALYSGGAQYHTADGYHALYNSETDFPNPANTAEGNLALLSNTIGSGNIALGDSAGTNLTTGSNNIDIGNKGVAGEANTIRIGKKGTQTTTYIAGVSGKTVANGVSAIIDSGGRLGTVNSSALYKENIGLMGDTSDAILSLRPVSFRYKHDLDPEKIPQFGLIAEDVAEVAPELVVRDDDGKPSSIRYQAINAMLLNEFVQEHRQVQGIQAEINQIVLSNTNQATLLRTSTEDLVSLKKTMEAHAMQIQKLEDQLALNRPASRIVKGRSDTTLNCNSRSDRKMIRSRASNEHAL